MISRQVDRQECHSVIKGNIGCPRHCEVGGEDHELNFTFLDMNIKYLLYKQCVEVRAVIQI